MHPFVLNRHDKMVFPSNFVPELDLSVVDNLDHLDRVIRRDFETKAPTGTEILQRVESSHYTSRYELLRDIALNMFWIGRYALTMYEKRPTRWRDVPRHRNDVFLPILTPWEDGDLKVAAVERAYAALPPTWDAAAEDRIFTILFDVFKHRKHHASELSAIKPTVAEILAEPRNLTFRLNGYDPDFPTFDFDDIIDCAEGTPELEALHRWAMVLHNQYPWDRSQAELVEVGQLGDDDYVVAFHPRGPDVRQFLRRAGTGGSVAPISPTPEATQPIRPYPAVNVRTHFPVRPRIEALAVVHGDTVCTNDDLIRNSAYNWSPMSADEIRDKTGIEARRYTSSSLEAIALEAARRALAHSGRGPADIGAVLVCTCTSSRLIPSVATWISGQLGIQQTHASFDIVAACAGMPYGMSDATRILQEVERPVLLICVEKFSDKIGNVRPSRMIFGDGAAAMVIGVAPEGQPSDIEYLQTYASGPVSQVNSILWPNPAFDNNITVYGPEVKALAGRYLGQMIDELKALPDPDGQAASLLDSIDLIVPHQANKTMVIQLANQAGLSEDRLYFNIDKVGNASSASIPLAIHDAVRDGVITKPVRVFAPGFGAGAVAGFAVMRVDPAVVAIADPSPDHTPRVDAESAPPSPAQSSDDVHLAFG
ncbi:MAG: ketoacyl-ACP synthase III [Intrasporangium sp.]|uniref:3-oxoacyl-ACP synthase III family protein n=1 Tax=Intrasporangium sp. TaxID=1925024 RepID=UPI0026498B62|nr:3-oxoacyl-[acyl-carrier-protein] synthase III C-terminal domain-containing protein [Intrasporangium sp.]MDN5798032.1 ketoacyl-ACP synthase III [Intrasporangium sp.]